MRLNEICPAPPKKPQRFGMNGEEQPMLLCLQPVPCSHFPGKLFRYKWPVGRDDNIIVIVPF